MSFTKIVATVGPSSLSPETLQRMATEGADVFRVNCSHQSTAEIGETIRLIRDAVANAGILVDIQGPKLRTGSRRIELPQGARVVLDPSDLSFDPRTVGVRVGEEMLFGDGAFRVRVLALGADGTEVEVLCGGSCAPRRGVNLPDTELTLPGGSLLSAKDVADIEMARRCGADWLALSFVGCADDVRQARALSGEMRIVAKIERRQALTNLEEIGEVADGLMTARGDLGVELPFETVPGAQERIAEWGLRSGKVTICATEMLESMRTGSRPTRAEVSDVAGAVRQGYGAVMLSAETAIGDDPVNVVSVMRRICEENEKAGSHKIFADCRPEYAAVAASVAALAMRTGADHILALTYTGYSASIIAACRPPAHIVAATPSPEVARWLRMHWGVDPIVVARDPDMSVAVEEAAAVGRDHGLLAAGETIVIAASRTNPHTAADTIWVHTI